MTIRSMPPASSHLADRPVPAPPPTIGSRRSTMPRNRSRMLGRARARHRRATLDDLGEARRAQRSANASSLMLCGSRIDAAVAVCVDAALERVEQGGVGVRVVERLARRVDQRDAALRAAGTAPGPSQRLSLLGDERADRARSRPASCASA